jgi:hypothetical protein
MELYAFLVFLTRLKSANLLALSLGQSLRNEAPIHACLRSYHLTTTLFTLSSSLPPTRTPAS